MAKKCANCGTEDGTILKEFDNEQSYFWSELSEMTEVCASCGECPELKPTTEEIKAYLKEFIDSMDGYGIITTDDELMDEFLNKWGDYTALRIMFSGE